MRQTSVTYDMMYRMRYIQVGAQLRAARHRGGLSQAALAARSGVSRVTIARLEASSLQDFRLGTLSRLCDALGLEITTLPRGSFPALEVRLARERERAHRLERRLRHAALAARLLDLPEGQALALVRRARERVERWEREGLCSRHYVSRWRALLAGSRRRVAAALLDPGEWGDALFENSPWTFALEPEAA
jgi:transcriptional regulator with XRE-family HTH domain